MPCRHSWSVGELNALGFRAGAAARYHTTASSRASSGSSVRMCPSQRPADDAAAEHVDDQCQVREADPGADVGEDLARPQLAGSLRGESALDQVGWPRSSRIRQGGLAVVSCRGAHRPIPARASTGRSGPGRCRPPRGAARTRRGPRRQAPARRPPDFSRCLRVTSPRKAAHRECGAVRGVAHSMRCI